MDAYRRFWWSCTFVILLGCETPYSEYYSQYVIPKGEHYSTYKVELLQRPGIRFSAYFDQSAQYSLDSINQWDTNKLMGFSDCNSHHQENSARFGWRWLEGKIDILVYCYTNGQRYIEKIGETMPDVIDQYSIELEKDKYVFIFNEKKVNVARGVKCEKGVYYVLYPFFGGNQPAPHDIVLYINRHY